MDLDLLFQIIDRDCKAGTRRPASEVREEYEVLENKPEGSLIIWTKHQYEHI